MEEGEELPPANYIKGQIGVCESDCDTSPHFIQKRKSVETVENGHGLESGPIIKIDASRLEERLLLGDEFVSVHCGQANDGQSNEGCCQDRADRSGLSFSHDGM